MEIYFSRNFDQLSVFGALLKTLILFFTLLLHLNLVSAGGISDGSFVRIMQSGGFSPFTKVIYDVTVRQGTAIFTMNREMNCYKGQLQEVRILSLEEAVEIFEGIKKIEHKLPKEEPEHLTGRVFEIWYSFGDSYGKKKISPEFLIENIQVHEFVNFLRDKVTEKTGGIPFRNLFFNPEKFGFLTVDAKKRGIIRIKELDEEFEIPLTLVELPAGVYNSEIIFTGEEAARIQKVFIIDSGLETLLVAE